MQSIIQIHPADNVAVALRDIEAGERVEAGDYQVVLPEAVARGHKFALRQIVAGENIVKYGLPIGHALSVIEPGVHIHSQNGKTNLSDLDQ